MSITLLTRDGCAACVAARADLTRICGEFSVEFISTRRGAVGSTARTRLSEAQRLLQSANATA
ncbi:hypothetical protein ACWDNR_03725, partial [Gordonia aichiensis]